MINSKFKEGDLEREEEALKSIEVVFRYRKFLPLGIMLFLFLLKFVVKPFPTLPLVIALIIGITLLMFPFLYFIKKGVNSLNSTTIYLLIAAETILELILFSIVFYLLKPIFVYYFEGVGTTIFVVAAFLLIYIVLGTPIFNNRKYTYFFFSLGCLILIAFGVLEYFGIHPVYPSYPVENLYRSYQLGPILVPLVMGLGMFSVIQIGVDNLWSKLRERGQELKKSNQELRNTQAQLIQSAKMGAVGQLGAGVAHELNNPLGGILGYAQFILNKFKRPEFETDGFKACQRYIESIERESTRCKKIVENLLRFSRMPISTKPEPVDMGRVIEEALSITGHQLKLKNVKVITDIKPDLAKVRVVINQLQQVFTNIILNAQQAMPDGGELRVSAENIIDSGTQNPTRIKIEFTDAGCGMPEEVLQRIFEPFFSTKQKEKGIGLGLSVSYQIVQDHRGTIDAKSQVGKGTTLVITLPVATPF